MTKIRSEPHLYHNALVLTNKKEKIITALGPLQLFGRLSIIEVSHTQTNNYNTINISVTVKSHKANRTLRSKMNIIADKKNDLWIYRTINIRIKKPEKLKKHQRGFRS